MVDWEYHQVELSVAQQEMKFTVLNPQILLYCTFLNLITFLFKGSVLLTDGLTRNVFSLRNLMEVLQNNFPLELKVSVLNFFINSYLFVEKSQILPVINELVGLIREDFYTHLEQYLQKCT